MVTETINLDADLDICDGCGGCGSHHLSFMAGKTYTFTAVIHTDDERELRVTCSGVFDDWAGKCGDAPRFVGEWRVSPTCPERELDECGLQPFDFQKVWGWK
jgi:hypothetical protein